MRFSVVKSQQNEAPLHLEATSIDPTGQHVKVRLNQYGEAGYRDVACNAVGRSLFLLTEKPV